MKALCTTLFFCLLLGFSIKAQVKIGLPAGAPQSSVILDLSNIGDGTRAFALPIVASTTLVLSPLSGMLVYDISSNSIKAYENSTWVSYSSQAATKQVVTVNCTSSAVNGFYKQGVALTAENTVTIVVSNNSYSLATLTPFISEIILSGPGSAGLTVASTLGSVSIGSGGGFDTITYLLGGTPTTLGSFTATFSKLSLSCVKTGKVCLPISSVTVNSITTPTILPIPISTGNIIDFTASGGTTNTGISWVMSSIPSTGIFSNPATGTGNIAQAVLVAGAVGSITVTYNATNACGLSEVAGMQTIYVGDAIRSALAAAGCASCAVYDTATNNTWVSVTAAEYQQLNTFMSINVAGCNETTMGKTSAAAETQGWTVLPYGGSATLLPSNNYIVAFSAIKHNGNTVNNAFLKFATAATGNYNTTGIYLKIPPTVGRIYNVLKSPTAVVNSSSASYVALFTGTGSNFLANYNNGGGTARYYGTANSTTIGTTDAYINLFQVKGTVLKKW